MTTPGMIKGNSDMILIVHIRPLESYDCWNSLQRLFDQGLSFETRERSIIIAVSKRVDVRIRVKQLP